jgi:homoserine dehydrogenase
MVKDRAGVFAQIGKILAKNAISISGILQHEGRGPDNTIPVVITTHPTQQSKVTAALKGMEKLDTVCSRPVCIRIVNIPEDKD